MQAERTQTVTVEAVVAALAARGATPDMALVRNVIAAVAKMDRIIARLTMAGDAVLDDLQTRQPDLPPAQEQAATQVLARVIEHTEALMLMRSTIASVVIEADDTEVLALMETGAAIADEILLAATQG